LRITPDRYFLGDSDDGDIASSAMVDDKNIPPGSGASFSFTPLGERRRASSNVNHVEKKQMPRRHPLTTGAMVWRRQLMARGHKKAAGLGLGHRMHGRAVGTKTKKRVKSVRDAAIQKS
jgi:hypothetical protein